MQKSSKEKLSIIKIGKRKTVLQEFNKIYKEWIDWQKEVLKIIDQPYDEQKELDVFKDGREMMEKHKVLQSKTLVFLDNNIVGHGFLKYDREDCRLKIRVRHRLTELNMLKESLKYANNFWIYYLNKIINFVIKLIKRYKCK